MGLSLSSFVRSMTASPHPLLPIDATPKRGIYFDSSACRPDKYRWYINGNIQSRDDVERDLRRCDLVNERDTGVGQHKFAHIVIASIDQMDILFRLCDGILEAHQCH